MDFSAFKLSIAAAEEKQEHQNEKQHTVVSVKKVLAAASCHSQHLQDYNFCVCFSRVA
ncbi:MAG: hypothetical protein L6V93_09725 [Clostridiales bacterium]|nr:MAG: hypothetical protein L6V93_09725 [Clostridiales bacterium]